MIAVDIDIVSAETVLDGYGAGALIRLERASSASGPWVEVATEPVVADVNGYTIWDSGGSSGNWYRSRVSDAALTTFSAYEAPFQVGTRLAYAEVEDLVELLPRVQAPRDENMLRDTLRRASAVIDARTGHDWHRHPNVSGTETRYYSVSRSGWWLDIPEGVVSVSELAIASWTGADYAVVDPATYFLHPRDRDYSRPFYGLALSPRSSAIVFYPGEAVVRITGVFGWPEVPEIIRSGTLALARQMVGETLTPGGAPRGEYDNPSTMLPTETYAAVRWAAGIGSSSDWFA